MSYWENLLDGMEPISYVEEKEQPKKRSLFHGYHINKAHSLAKAQPDKGSIMTSARRN